MPIPNLKNISSIYAKTATLSLTTSATDILQNSAESNKTLKISSLLIANVGTASATYTLDFFRSSTAKRIVKDLSVSVGGTSVALSRDTTIYLEEGDSLRLTASGNSSLEALCSYEEIT